MDIGESVNYSYTGDVQTFTVETDGIYRLEVWGAASGANGGYSIGYKELKQGTTLYICCGGTYSGQTGGYNGGGNGGSYNCSWSLWYAEVYGNGGGGATHIALVDGTLASIGKETFDIDGLIVAGGASGAWSCYFPNESEHNSGSGYAGGGESGEGNGQASQTTGYAFGQGQSSTGSGNFNTGAAGGGGGYYGGYTSESYSGQAGGGSGWIGNVDDYNDYKKSTSNAVNSGTGKATITLMELSSNRIVKYQVGGVVYSNEDIATISLDGTSYTLGTDIKKIIIDGVEYDT